MKSNNKYLYLYLGISFAVCWGIAIAFILFEDFLVPLTGELTLMHPLAIIALYSPSIAGIITYYVMGGTEALKGLFSKLIPRKQDLVWFPIILGIFILFGLTMHYGSLLFGLPVPDITFTVPEMFIAALVNFIKETGLIGGVFGWIGFLLPFLQGKFKNNITSALLTGFLFGLWVLPGYIISSFGTSTSYLFYVAQLMVFVVFQSYIFNATKGNLLFYLFAFWLAATGSQIQLYFFNPDVQKLQISYFIIAAVVIHFVFKKRNIAQPLQVFPDFIKA
ncbi:hypothetical protein [Paenibacillus wynnii]|uniref:hypothetical protein n=1 Tax=Paenibacillus wynnii TaxID=268407 RepID=UPI000A52286F|nr:hypothetical protein [Paenibacillus wynnii]